MERADGFVAASLLQRLSRAAKGKTAAACTSFPGAVLFVDISGYTALAESLCTKGRDGVEHLGRVLDRALRSYVRVVQEGGGEIAAFAGDAFLAYWSAGDDRAEAATRASAGAAALHAVPRRAEITSLEPHPTLHIGLSAGEIWAARLGEPERWRVLLAGSTVREACTAAGRAPAGVTEVAAAARRLLSASSLVPAAVAVDAPVADDTFAASVDVSGHVPRRVQEYLGVGYTAWIPQRRNICALFVRIDGLDESAPDALGRHQAVASSIDLALRPFTGTGGSLLLDDKGLVFTLCLGMPHDAHADDALRAVRAGLAIQTEVSRLGLSCAIGVANGDGVCMPLGLPERRHFWSVGRFMHIGGRLMEAAGRGMLCTEGIADHVRRVVSLSPERPLTLKGVSHPVRVFRAQEAAAFGEHVEQMFGREDEQAALDQCLDAFEAGRGTVMSIVGEAGIGKTTMAGYMRKAAERRGLRCISGSAGSIEMAAPYAAWRPLFSTLLAAAPGGTDMPGDRQRRLGGIRHALLASLVNAVVPGFLEETPLVQSLAGQARADAISTVLEEVLEAHASRRFVLIFEDCHWMDSASWRLLLRVAQDFPDALLVLTARPAADVQEANTLRASSRFTEMILTALRPSAITSIVESVLGGREVAPELVGEIGQRSKGNPLFAREYALLLTAHGGSREPITASSSPISAPVRDIVPMTVQSLVASRLDALSPSEDLALKSASVLGDGFSIEAMTQVFPGDQRQEVIQALLTGLIEQQLLHASADGTRFGFQHALIGEVAYQQLTREQRRDLHRRAAEALERQHAADLRPHFAMLAHHWSAAEESSATLRYSDLAASQALAAGAFEEAERLLSTCMRVAGETSAEAPPIVRIRWCRQIADARHGMGQLEARSAAAHQALREAGLPRPHSRVALLGRSLVRLARLNVRRAIPAVPDAAASTILDVARAYRHSAEVCYFNNDMVGMVFDSASAVAYASSLPPSAVLAGASAELGGILSVAGFRRIGERILTRATTMAEAANDQAAQAYAHLISCLYYIGHGDWASAERSAQRCQELCEPMDDRVNWTNAQAVRFWMSHYRSHDAAALDAARHLRDRALETGNRQHRAWGLRCLAVCALRRDEAREAVSLLHEALKGLGETAALNERMPTLGMLALAQLKSGDVWSARATAKEGLAQIAHAKRPIGQSTLEGYSCLLIVALHAWQEERSPDWRRGCRRCLQVLRRYRKGFPVGAARYYLHRGDFHRLSGALGAARRAYRRGELAAQRLGMPWEARRCRQALAELTEARY